MYEVILKETNEVLGFHQQPERANILACWFASNKAFDLDPDTVKDLSGLFDWEQIEGNSRNNWQELYEVKFSELREKKEKKKEEIKDSWLESFRSGTLESSLGFTMDNRRAGEKNDLQNLETLRDLGVLDIKDAEGNMHLLTSTQLDTLIGEMKLDGVQKYQKKWSLEGTVESCASLEELEAIYW